MIGGWAQNFKSTDRYAQRAPAKLHRDFGALTDYLAGVDTSSLQRVRSFYTWITKNIDYDPEAYNDGRRRVNRSTNDVLRRQRAVCFGYSILFRDMCRRIGISCEIVHGYVRQNGIAGLSAPNHSWNAVQINGQWQLLDLTWASGNKGMQEFYFLTPPEVLLETHLAAEPMWQLVDCPVPPATFQKEAAYTQAYLQNCPKRDYAFADSIAQWRQLPRPQQRLAAAQATYFFHPIQTNREQLGHSYMDLVADLTDRATELEMADSLLALEKIQLEIIDLAQRAMQFIELYPRQQENVAYTHLNYGVALSRRLANNNDNRSLLLEMEKHFRQALELLQNVPANFMTESATAQLNEYLEWISTHPQY